MTVKVEHVSDKDLFFLLKAKGKHCAQMSSPIEIVSSDVDIKDMPQAAQFAFFGSFLPCFLRIQL